MRSNPKHVEFHGLRVSYHDHLDGGGSTLGQQFIPVVAERLGPVGHVFEFCAGPGFIGFSLLAHQLCERLTLADINPEAVEVCRETIRENGLAGKVRAYVSDCLDDIPTDEKWDLVVGNPPHFHCAEEGGPRNDPRSFDPLFAVHKKFYGAVGKFLKPGGSVLLMENGDATNVDDFRLMIEGNGLRIVDVFKISLRHPKLYFNPRFWSHLRHVVKIARGLKEDWPGCRLRSQFITPFYFIWCKPR